MDRQMIVSTALELLEETGLDALTVRKLSERLNVKSPALYWHFANKAELLAEMAHAVQSKEDQGPPRQGESWRQWLTRRARDRRRILLSHRDGVRLVTGTRPRDDMMTGFEAGLRALADHGFTPVQALTAIGTINRYVIGFVLEEQAATDDAPPPPDAEALQAVPTLTAAIRDSGTSDDAFDRGLHILINGIATDVPQGQPKG